MSSSPRFWNGASENARGSADTGPRPPSAVSCADAGGTRPARPTTSRRTAPPTPPGTARPFVARTTLRSAASAVAPRGAHEPPRHARALRRRAVAKRSPASARISEPIAGDYLRDTQGSTKSGSSAWPAPTRRRSARHRSTRGRTSRLRRGRRQSRWTTRGSGQGSDRSST